jgi:hypothetical protein
MIIDDHEISPSGPRRAEGIDVIADSRAVPTRLRPRVR